MDLRLGPPVSQSQAPYAAGRDAGQPEAITAAIAAEEEIMSSFFAKLKAGIESMWKKAPSVTVAAASAVNYVVPFIESIDVLVTPELAPVLNPILDKIKVGLTALKVTVQDAGATPNLSSIVASVNTNLTALISAAQIKDAALAQKIQAVATLVTGELAAITG
jgi:hypothetical protein